MWMFSPIENYKFAWFQSLAPILGFLVTEQTSFPLVFLLANVLAHYQRTK